jgi:3-oxoacyl-[acyl-carrier protein] reductase
MGDSLQGKVAIVTGSGQGIGRGIAISLAREGAAVITNNRQPGSGTVAEWRDKRDEIPESDWEEMLKLAGDAEGAAEMIRREGGTAEPFYGDVSDQSVAKELVDFAIKTFGRIDIIVNNAAGMGSGSVATLSEKTWDKIANTRQKAAFNLSHFAIPHMIEQGFGRIINASSDAWIGLPDNSAYSASTAGMVGFTWAAAKELWRYGITVNAFCPQGESPSHAIEYNKMLRNVKAITGKDPDPNVLKVVEENHGDPVGVGSVIAFLGSETASYISGTVFAIYASGIVKLYSQPDYIADIARPDDNPWTQEGLAAAFRDQLLGPDYVAPGSKAGW